MKVRGELLSISGEREIPLTAILANVDGTNEKLAINGNLARGTLFWTLKIFW